jgi:peptidyl-prolyl cis-trans isomerase D
MAPAQAFSGAGVSLPAVQRVSSRRIDIARPGQPVPPPLAMMFSLARGKARILEAPNGEGWFVVHLESTTPGNATGQNGLIQATRTQFQGALGDEYAAQFNRAIQAGLKVERDEAKIAQVKRQLQSGHRSNKPRACMILVVDNYDSFTWNIVRYLRELGAEVRVVRNDEIGVPEALNSGAAGPC